MILAAVSVMAQQQDPEIPSSSETASTDAARTVEDDSVSAVFSLDDEASSPPSSDNLQLGDLFQKLNAMEREISHVLGRIEELEHQVQLLRHENRDRYIELDDRLREVSGQAPTSPTAIGTASPGTEAGMYRTAFELVEDQQYEEAISQFESMIEQYPNGKLLPEAFYWLGELHAKLDPPQLEEARQNLVQLVRLFPNHSKTPEGTFKLGTIYHQLEDLPKALEYLDRVTKDYPDSSVARLAEEYASNIR